MFFFALNGDMVVGIAGLNWTNSSRVRHYGEYGTTVLKSYWGKGIATNLFSHILKEAPNCKIEKIGLETSEMNESALKLYKRLGFVVEGN